MGQWSVLKARNSLHPLNKAQVEGKRLGQWSVLKARNSLHPLNKAQVEGNKVGTMVRAEGQELTTPTK